MQRTHVKGGDVLLNITGASIGRTTFIPNDFGPANVNQHVCIIRTDG
jgi:type I restriction enzyme, S subunit